MQGGQEPPVARFVILNINGFRCLGEAGGGGVRSRSSVAQKRTLSAPQRVGEHGRLIEGKRGEGKKGNGEEKRREGEEEERKGEGMEKKRGKGEKGRKGGIEGRKGGKKG